MLPSDWIIVQVIKVLCIVREDSTDVDQIRRITCAIMALGHKG